MLADKVFKITKRYYEHQVCEFFLKIEMWLCTWQHFEFLLECGAKMQCMEKKTVKTFMLQTKLVPSNY